MKHLICAFLLAGTSMIHAAETRTSIQVFSRPLTEIPQKNSRIDYDVNLEDQTFVVHEPANYDGSKAFGLLVYIPSAGNPTKPPKGWESVLEARDILFVMPQKAVNSMDESPRLGLAVIAAIKMKEKYRIDSNRVYAAGISGGARMAGRLGFYQSDLFRGTVQSCGADFPQPVSRVRAVEQDRDKGHEYGLISATDGEYESAKTRVRFVIVTGPGDFRYGHLLDLFEGGFRKHKFSATLINDPLMKHEPCSAASLRAALNFIEQR